MYISKVNIRNFRCLEDVDISFDKVTSFIGPNGAGKSTVLRALDWFFNGEKNSGLNSEDRYSAAQSGSAISVTVTFSDLNEADREALGETYAPAGTGTFSATRTWTETEDKTTGSGRTLPEFDEVRRISGKTDRRKAYEKLAENAPDLNLPECRTGDAVDAAMRIWESNNPDRLEHSDIPANHFFGFNGKNVLSGIFDYVFVSADLRASEQSVEGRKTILSRILERTLDRGPLNEAYAKLSEDFSSRQSDINATHLNDQLADLGDALSSEISAFSRGRTVHLSGYNVEIKPSPPAIQLTVSDEQSETSIDRQGHGFQRTLLIAALKLLAERAYDKALDSVIVLAVEEPELFQHPTQARVFSSVLRSLASSELTGIQVAYATHSHHFVNAAYFDQVRRVTRASGLGSQNKVLISQASMSEVQDDLNGFVTTKALISRWDQVCTSGLAEALFSEAVVLVEGTTDKAIIEGAAYQDGGVPLERLGIAVAEAGSKSLLPIPHAILKRLNIPCLVVFDNDQESGARAAAGAKIDRDSELSEAQQRNQAERKEHRHQINANRKLLEYMQEPLQDFPSGVVSPTLFAWEDTLEAVISAEWMEWETTREKIVLDERGAPGKNAATYKLAAQESGNFPGGALAAVLASARSLVES